MRIGTIPALVAAVTLAMAPAVQAAPRAPGERPAVGTVEEGLWSQFERAERDARASGEIITDPALNAYVKEVTCKVAAEYCPDLRVYVMNRPFFNAQMAGNGYTEVWSGALLRAESEAELAFVMGHEVSHFAENHSMERWQAMKNTSDAMLALSLTVAVAGAAVAANASSYDAARSIMDLTRGIIDVAYLVAIAGLFRFTREQEAESDQAGLLRMQRAGYKPTSAVLTWQFLLDENANSEFEKVRKSQAHTNIFDSHPIIPTRIQALNVAAAALPQTGEEGRERHRAVIRPHLSAWLKDDLRRRDFNQTLFLLDRLDNHGEDLGVIGFYRGETFRLRRGDGDARRAEDAYAAAVVHADVPVAAWRELGELRRKRGDAAGARQAFETYLARAPQAEDAWIVQDSLNSLGGT